MGGFMSGRRPPSPDAAPLVEHCTALDATRLQHSCDLRPGAETFGLAPVPLGGGAIAVVMLAFDLRQDWQITISLPGHSNPDPAPTAVPLEFTRPPLGGLRLWFRCPVNGSRVQKLYWRADTRRFASRTAQGLAYTSQRYRRVDRARWRLQRLAARAGGTYDGNTGLPPRPRGMHWRTYARLNTAADACVEIIEADFVDGLHRWREKLQPGLP